MPGREWRLGRLVMDHKRALGILTKECGFPRREWEGAGEERWRYFPHEGNDDDDDAIHYLLHIFVDVEI